MNTIRKYELLEKLGEGGMGVVWKARDTELDRLVVIKAIHDDYVLNAELRKRFIDEARIQARLVHPNICTLFDAFEEERKLFLVMELIEGQTLKEPIEAEGRGLPAARVVEIAKGVLSGLHFAHEHGVVHRDIKPSNIMVDRHGHVKIMDFGIAKALGVERMGKTKTGMTVGTPEYMSPEQILGKDVDARSDIYSFGIMLYEMLTGTLPFEHTSSEYEIQKFHVEGAVPSVSQINPRVFPHIENVLKKCLTKQPSERFQSAEDAQRAMLAPKLADLPKSQTLEAEPQCKTASLARVCMAARRHCVPVIAMIVLCFTGFGVALIWPKVHATVAPFAGLAYGSREAHQRQLQAVLDTGLPLEKQLKVTGIKFRLIPEGTFVMGCPESERGRRSDERQRRVTISRPFYMGMYEITQEQWFRVMGTTPSCYNHLGMNRPVETVTWNECQEFLRKLEQIESLQPNSLRLPTEA